ncbi:hypothetical protein EBT25_01045 [bacterium]|jgi:hypothetical protein|nr:hypothetical protein [bacterium]
MFDLKLFDIKHTQLREAADIDFFIKCCDLHVQKNGRYKENYTQEKIVELIGRGRFDQGVIYLFYDGEVVAFTGLESYQGKHALFATRYCVLRPSPVPYAVFFLLPKVLEIGRLNGYKHVGGSTNKDNRHMTKMMLATRNLKGTPFEPYIEQYEECLKNYFEGEKQIYNGVEQQLYFISI